MLVKSGHENADEVKEKCEVSGWSELSLSSLVPLWCLRWLKPSNERIRILLLYFFQDLKDRWDRLRDLAKARRKKLEDAQESHTYYADANEAES